MSERCGDGISPEDLLMKVSVDELSSKAAQEALGEYQRAIYQRRAKDELLSKLNQQIRMMYYSGNSDNEEYITLREKASACAEDINSLNRQVITLLKGEELSSLYKTLYEKKSAEDKERFQQYLEQRRLKKEREYEDFLEKRRAEREAKMLHAASDMLAKANAVDPIEMKIRQAQSREFLEKKQKEQEEAREKERLKAAALELTAIAKEVGSLTYQINRINDELSRLKFALWGKRWRRKQELEHLRTQLNSRLAALYKRRSQLCD